jgi:DNA-binding NarL/FixJ family response regulator
LRVLLVDGDRASRNLLCRVLGHDDRFEVAGAVGSYDRVVTFEGTFDVALVDLLTDGSLDVVVALRARVPSPAVVVRAPLTATYLRAAVAAAGASGLILTGAGMPELLGLMAGCRPSAALCGPDEGHPQQGRRAPGVGTP